MKTAHDQEIEVNERREYRAHIKEATEIAALRKERDAMRSALREAATVKRSLTVQPVEKTGPE